MNNFLYLNSSKIIYTKKNLDIRKPFFAKKFCQSFGLSLNQSSTIKKNSIYVVVNFLFQLIFIFPLFLGMVMYANEF